jgi:hypothetical protein
VPIFYSSSGCNLFDKHEEEIKSNEDWIMKFKRQKNPHGDFETTGLLVTILTYKK